MSEETFKAANQGIDRAIKLAKKDKRSHDLTVGLGVGDTGFTVHVNDYPLEKAMGSLVDHCKRRKYTQKAVSWFGVSLSPTDSRMRFGLALDYPWMDDSEMDENTKGMRAPAAGVNAALNLLAPKHKTGRNEPCPCGSGLKYKKCCLP